MRAGDPITPSSALSAASKAKCRGAHVATGARGLGCDGGASACGNIFQPYEALDFGRVAGEGQVPGKSPLALALALLDVWEGGSVWSRERSCPQPWVHLGVWAGLGGAQALSRRLSRSGGGGSGRACERPRGRGDAVSRAGSCSKGQTKGTMGSAAGLLGSPRLRAPGVGEEGEALGLAAKGSFPLCSHPSSEPKDKPYPSRGLSPAKHLAAGTQTGRAYLGAMCLAVG